MGNQDCHVKGLRAASERHENLPICGFLRSLQRPLIRIVLLGSPATEIVADGPGKKIRQAT
jgi:hypothetical protein